MKCKHLKNMPNVATEWQMMISVPGCAYYCDGDCCDKHRKRYDDPCEFELTGGTLPLKMVPVCGNNTRDVRIRN